jgi:two-component system, cell cycle sensor histidine kinase and response regulator CckA
MHSTEQTDERTEHIRHIRTSLEPARSRLPTSTASVRLLHLEDNPRDAKWIHKTLDDAGLANHIRHVCDRDEFDAALSEDTYDLILCDLDPRDYHCESALSLARSKQPNVPVIVITSAKGEEQAVKCLHLGATDYLLKQRLERLPNAVRRAIAEAEEQQHLRDAERELRESEVRFRLLAQHSKEVFWFVGLHPKRMLYVSPAVEAIWGSPVARFYEDPAFWQRAIAPEDQPRVRAAWEACARGEASRFDVEYRVIHTDGSVRLVADTGAVSIDDARGGVHISGMARDITERAKLEQELRQSHKMEGIGQLAGGIAHDFNNLLTIIQGNSDLALDELDPESTVSSDICEIKRAATSAASLTKQLLAFSRRQMLQPRPVELCAVARSVEKMLSRLIGDNIELVLELDERCGYVFADYGQIEQVIINLTVNARDAMPGGGRITIATSTVPHHPGGDTAEDMVPYERLTVTDTGVGMDLATRERIFEPFFTTKPVGQGTGLGLSTVHGIVKQSRGDIQLSSAPGLGTTFTLYFPQCEAETAMKIVPVQPRAIAGTETVLVVEDQPSLRDLVVRILRQRGYDVLHASDGDEALRVAAATTLPIQLVISDVVMPGMSARAMVEQLRESRPEVRVLLMSGYHNDDEILHILKNPNVDFLQKPFLPQDLAEKVRAVLERA